MPLLQMENITKQYGKETAVDNLSLNVEKGQFKSLLGPSGCGKTTTLRSVAGLERPDEGRILIDGEVVFDANQGINQNPEDRDVGMVFQSYAVWPHMTVRENVSFPLEMDKVSKDERKNRVDEILETVGLGPYADDLATNLSGGQQQRVAIARALVVEPKIILFDEPLASLDAKLRREMRLEIKQICSEFDATILYVTHAQDEAMFLSDEIALMNNGRVVEEGEPETLHQDPEELFSMEFMGHTNVLDGKIKNVKIPSSAVVDTNIGDIVVNDVDANFRTGDSCIVTVRPKSIDIDPATKQNSDNVFEGTVNFSGPTRDFTEYDIDIKGKSVTTKTTNPVGINKGDRINLFIDPNVAKVWESSEAKKGAVIMQGQE